MDKDRIFVDANVIVTDCISRDTMPTYNFFRYLRRHKIGSITKETVDVAKNSTRKAACKISIEKPSRHIYENIMEKFYDVVSELEVETVPYHQSQENLKKLNSLFNYLFRKNDCPIPSMVSRRFQKSVEDAYLEQFIRDSGGKTPDKIFCQPISEDDLKIIADVVTLHEKKYSDSDMHLASFDGHFVHEEISNEIKERFDVTCGRPNHILHKIKEKDLSKIKPISDICGL